MVTDDALKILNNKFVEVVEDEDSNFSYRTKKGAPKKIVEELKKLKELVIKYP